MRVESDRSAIEFERIYVVGNFEAIEERIPRGGEELVERIGIRARQPR